MSGFLFIYLLILCFFGIIYVALILFYTLGWFRLRPYTAEQKPGQQTRCSVIVPARNESRNIKGLLDDLLAQTFPRHLFEVIIIDDHSTDNTASLVEGFAAAHTGFDLKLIRLTSDLKVTAFKKRAIEEAIRISAGELIITTDADCHMGTDWLRTIVSFYEAEKPKMVVGPVSYHREESVFQKMQTEEFLSLIAITGGAIRMHRPIMCNGANLAYEKSAFYEAGGFGTTRLSSGDDVFLMLQVRKIFGSRSIRFLKSREAIVFTEAKKRVADFFQQRTRWASKNKGYEFNILFVSFSVYMINLLLLAGISALIIRPEWWPVVLTTLVIKVLIDLPILIGIGNFVKRPGLIVYSLPLVVVYPFYIVLTGAMGVLVSYRWKGRKVKN